MDDDPDFEDIHSTVGSVASKSSGGTSFLLRSVCRHQGPCNEGHGLEFHSRISPSPARSYHKRRRRKSWRASLDSSPEDAPEEVPPRSVPSSSARRDLSDVLAREERTSGWVANLKREETSQRGTLKLTTVTKSFAEETTVTMSRIVLKTPTKIEPWNRSVTGGSPRLQAFDGDAWKRSPRTGYTYVDSPTYRQQWTPDREIPMPHMARRPLDEYNDGEVAFSAPPLFNLDFSSDEEEEDSVQVTKFPSRQFSFITQLLSILLIGSYKKSAAWLFNVHGKLEAFFRLATRQTIRVSSLLLVAFEMTLPYLIPYRVPNSGNDFPVNSNKENDGEEIAEEEVTYIKRVTRFYHDIYNWSVKPDKSISVLMDLYVGSMKKAFSVISGSLAIVKRAVSKSTKVAISVPKALVLLLIPSILTNLVAEAETVPGVSSFSHKGPPLVVNEVTFVHRITYNIKEVYIWAKKRLNHVPDVRAAIKSVAEIVAGFVFSVLLFFNPKNLWSILPKVSRRRVRRWRKSRGPPTRFSARIRNMPVQFTGELPARTKRTRRIPAKPALIIPDEPVEIRIAKIMDDFETKVAAFKPGLIARALSTIVNKLGYFKEEEMELRRSLRLRGLAPEFEGLMDSKKARRPRPEFDEMPKPIEQLLRPEREPILSRIFSYFGYFDQAEIIRRRSLRLQGLDPEFEGLTWGKRKRAKSSKLLRYFGNYHDDDEVFFEYNEPDLQDNFMQRWLDSLLHIIGYLQYEDIHEEEEIEEEEEEGEDVSYVEIPSESFVHLQQQHELFENSFTFEPTEAVFEGKISVTKDGSCLGIILILSIPVLLLLSLIIFDSKSTTEVLALSLTNMCKDSFNAFLGAFSYISWMLVPIKQGSTTLKEEILPPIDYDHLAKQILDNSKFVHYINGLKFSQADDIKAQLTQLLESRLEEVSKKLDLSDDVTQNLVDFVHDVESRHSKSMQLLHKEQILLMQQVDSSLKALKTLDSREDVVALQDKLSKITNEVLHLDELVKACCKANQENSVDANALLQTFLAAQKSQFMSKADFEVELSKIINFVKFTLLEQSKQEVFAMIDSKVTTVLANATHQKVLEKDDISRIDIEDMVKSALLVYGADKTGAFDFALETAGGSVVSTRCTQMYTEQLPTLTWLGVPLWLPLPAWGPATNPRTAIQPGIMPGECWAFKGHEGFLVVKLAMPMKPTRFSIEHIPKSLSPTGKIDSAPKDFMVMGLTQEQDPYPEDLGRFSYDDQGEPLQFFNVANPRDYAFAYVELRILNNHGNDKYTCLYRFRVHGAL